MNAIDMALRQAEMEYQRDRAKQRRRIDSMITWAEGFVLGLSAGLGVIIIAAMVFGG